MDVFIHEDYVNKRNEVRREQRKQLQMLQRRQTASRPAPACVGGEPGSTERHVIVHRQVSHVKLVGGGRGRRFVGSPLPIRLPQAVLGI